MPSDVNEICENAVIRTENRRNSNDRLVNKRTENGRFWVLNN